MTRPYRTFHDYASQIGHYVSRDGQLICGSLMEPSVGHLMRALRVYEMPHGAGLLHTTLSAPEGRHYADHEWQEIACFVLERSGLPPNLVPWMAAGREARGTDHIHIISARQTWSGRFLEAQTSVCATDQLAIDLSHRLGCPEPAWMPSNTNSLLSQIRKGAPEPVRDFADQVNMAIQLHLPTTAAELDEALARTGSHWRVNPSDGRDGLLAPWNELTGDVIYNPKMAGGAFSSARLMSRLALAARIRLQRVANTLRNLSQIIPAFLIPALKKDPKYDDNEIGRGRTGKKNRRDAEGSEDALSAPRLARAPGQRSDVRLRRKTAGVHAGDRDELHRPDDTVRGPAERSSRDRRSAEQLEPTVGFLDEGRVARGHWILRFLTISREHQLDFRHRLSEDGEAVAIFLNEKEACKFWFDEAIFTSKYPTPTGSMAMFQNAVREKFGMREAGEGPDGSMLVTDSPEMPGL